VRRQLLRAQAAFSSNALALDLFALDELGVARSVISTLRSIWRTITSMCLSLIFTPCRRYTSWISFTM
jgi:hypothetical protein